MTEFIALLQDRTRQRIPLDELRKMYFTLYPGVQNSPDRSAQLLDALRQLEAAGVIVLPASGSWEARGSPPLPKWVSLARAKKSDEVLDFDDIAWAPELGFWTELKKGQLAKLARINQFLLKRRGNFGLVPIKERSLEIFGDEKFLDDNCLNDALFNGKLPLSTIGCFRVPQPLPYRVVAVPGRPLLIVENHNTYWSFAEWNIRARKYSAIVYGQGENFRLTGRALHQVIDEVGASGAEYFGDTDTRGVTIPMEFNGRAEPGYPKVFAARPLYRWLLEHGVRRSKSACKTFVSGAAQSWLGTELGEELEDVWRVGEWMPQEALGTEQLALIDVLEEC